MSFDKIIAIAAGAGIIAFVYKFFLGKRRPVQAVETTDVKVQGGYDPEVITVKAGSATTLMFTRTDASPCLEEIVLPDFSIRKFLPLNEKVRVEIVPEKPGEYQISCGMNMFHGKIIAK